MRRKHQRRVLINLLVIAVLALFLWVHEGCHLPTLEMELHRTERQRLAEESRVVWTYDGRAYNDRDMLVGVTGNGVHAYSEVYGLDIWPRSVAEPTLVILPNETRYTVQGGSYLGPALLAVDPPAGAETSQLTLDLSSSWGEEYVFTDRSRCGQTSPASWPSRAMGAMERKIGSGSLTPWSFLTGAGL